MPNRAKIQGSASLAAPGAPGRHETQRDTTLDLWRGLALADMVLVHLAWNRVLPEAFGALVRDHTRFAAGGLVLLSGLTAALIFGPKLAAGGARAPRRDARPAADATQAALATSWAAVEAWPRLQRLGA